MSDSGDKRFRNEPSSPASSDETLMISKNSPLRRRLGMAASNSADTAVPRQSISLVIRGMVERVTLSEDKPITVGRADVKRGSRPDVDLTPYGAQEHGVSREHVRLHLHEHHLYVTDLGSSNGTFLAGRQVSPDDPQMLYDKAELLLGRLAVQVLFG